ncbi:MAG: hypothetical protein ACRCYO_14875 [Bacteroidia bacterium]
MIIAFCSTICSCDQTLKDNSIVGLVVDSTIKSEVAKYISPSEFGAMQNDFLIYNNLMLVDFFEDDTLSLSLKEEDNKRAAFKSFYYWQKDTFSIDGAFGVFDGQGFSIKMINGKAILYHMLASDEFPSYAYKENDELIYRLEVPCTDTKIVLSEVPDSTKKQIIYGYVEFKSADYYMSRGSAEGQEFLPRKKLRANMRVYFKSAKLNS